MKIGRAAAAPPGARLRAFGKDALLALQHALTHQAIRTGRCRVVGAPPPASWLTRIDPGLMRRWLPDARALLDGGGCRLLEPHGARMRPQVVVGPAQPEEAPGAATEDVHDIGRPARRADTAGAEVRLPPRARRPCG